MKATGYFAYVRIYNQRLKGAQKPFFIRGGDTLTCTDRIVNEGHGVVVVRFLYFAELCCRMYVELSQELGEAAGKKVHNSLCGRCHLTWR